MGFPQRRERWFFLRERKGFIRARRGRAASCSWIGSFVLDEVGGWESGRRLAFNQTGEQRRHAAGGRREGLGASSDRRKPSTFRACPGGTVCTAPCPGVRRSDGPESDPRPLSGFEPGQMAISVRRLETAPLDGEGSVALALGSSQVRVKARLSAGPSGQGRITEGPARKRSSGVWTIRN